MSRFFLAFLLFLALFAGWAMWYITPAGLGLTNDSAAYLGGARSILAGTGYSDIWLDSALEPITHYPPLFSLTLSSISLLTGLDPYRAARALHIILFAANTVLLGWLGWRITHSQMAALLLALLFALNGQLLTLHAYAMSEPLFLFFSLLSFLSFDLAPPKTRKTAIAALFTKNRLLLTGFFSGLAFLTRYSGLALIATLVVSIFLLAPDARLKRIITFMAGAIPPIAAWFVRNALVAESATNRTFHFNPIELSNIRTGLWNAAHFLAPLPGLPEWLFQSGLLQIGLTIAGVGLLGWLGYQAYQAYHLRQSVNPLLFITALYVWGYLGAVLFSMSFFDASTKFQPRILSPLYVSWLILLTASLHFLWKWKPPVSPVLTTLAVVALLLLSGLNAQNTITELRTIDGLGYASWRWRQAEVLAYIRRLPPEIAIYTNSPPAVYHVTGRASRVIPTFLNPVSGLPRPDYEQALAEMRQELFAGRAVLVLFEVSNLEEAFGHEVALQFDGLPVLLKAQGHVLYGKLEKPQ